jgi:hypothetical protein
VAIGRLIEGKKMIEGVVIFGKLLEVIEEPWAKNGKNGTNRYLNLSRTYYNEDSGEEAQGKQRIDIGNAAYEKNAHVLRAQIGNSIAIQVAANAKAFNGRAFPTFFFVRALNPQSFAAQRAA